eukprot:CAMPEP_0204543282 /NCGR_PEP_ID=MMETSP0661-20131031/19642_1 /ASSEMBLY_ACC=CAM_ASM_000606 /TAXON_ID=109239 /ORGANISM="Alexandrium margalefi, Strain AMGDE01CS-322" /LENGTH=54 /DNA_ID=CAMNT_0051550005 /DNA_START=236 /DNA_END=396 /DNA_ORIENTATION=-
MAMPATATSATQSIHAKEATPAPLAPTDAMSTEAFSSNPAWLALLSWLAFLSWP